MAELKLDLVQSLNHFYCCGQIDDAMGIKLGLPSLLITYFLGLTVFVQSSPLLIMCFWDSLCLTLWAHLVTFEYRGLFVLSLNL